MVKEKNIPKLRFPEFKGEWETKNMADIAKFSKGKGLSKSEINENGAIDCIRYGELYTRYKEVIKEVYSRTDSNVKNMVLSEENDVIIPSSGETQIDIATASCVLKSGVVLGGDLNIIKTENNGVFLSYYLNNRKKIEIAKLAQGNSIVHLYSHQLASLNINLPTLPEQNQIASFFSLIDKKITELKRKKNLLEQYKKGVMQKIFSQKLRFKDDKGKEFPKWEKKKLEDIFFSMKGKGISKDRINEKGLYECILYGELYTKYSEIIHNVISRTNENNGLKSKKGDLLLPSSTTTTGIDLANVTALNKNDVMLGGDITVLRTKKQINNIFYAYYLTYYKKREISKLTQGITIIHLYYSHMKNIKIDYPYIEEQTKIANFLSAIDKKINFTQTQIEKAEKWKKGLLQKMFC